MTGVQSGRPNLLNDQNQRREPQPIADSIKDETLPLEGHTLSDAEVERAFEESWIDHEASYRYLVDR